MTALRHIPPRVFKRVRRQKKKIGLWKDPSWLRQTQLGWLWRHENRSTSLVWGTFDAYFPLSSLVRLRRPHWLIIDGTVRRWAICACHIECRFMTPFWTAWIPTALVQLLSVLNSRECYANPHIYSPDVRKWKIQWVGKASKSMFARAICALRKEWKSSHAHVMECRLPCFRCI